MAALLTQLRRRRNHSPAPWLPTEQLQQCSNFVFEHSWSWGESNSRPLGGYLTCYDHSRDCGCTATTSPGRLNRSSPPSLSLKSAVFLAVSGLSLPSTTTSVAGL